jgi:hypothetical protein
LPEVAENVITSSFAFDRRNRPDFVAGPDQKRNKLRFCSRVGVADVPVSRSRTMAGWMA